MAVNCQYDLFDDSRKTKEKMKPNNRSHEKKDLLRNLLGNFINFISQTRQDFKSQNSSI